MPATVSPTARPRVLHRLAAAVLGGYALAAATAIGLGAVLPSTRADAVLAGVQWSLVVYPAAVIWAFSPVPLARVWAGLLGPAALMVLAGWLFPRLRG